MHLEGHNLARREPSMLTTPSPFVLSCIRKLCETRESGLCPLSCTVSHYTAALCPACAKHRDQEGNA